LTPISAGVLAAPAFDYNPLTTVLVLLTIWFGAEALLAKAARWHVGLLSPLAWLLRDLLLPLLWLEGWAGDTFVWRGNDMSVAKGSSAEEHHGRELAAAPDIG
jgi:ceramide glucosyltransferase